MLPRISIRIKVYIKLEQITGHFPKRRQRTVPCLLSEPKLIKRVTNNFIYGIILIL